ncbi:hypothetical protein FOS14_00165 [Skermania sp. ID1734]|uniref:TY-Chap domain-containing protein n=1 Tax=Skermania sp. ID1734 TaxID=2597516 RepID=UPI00117EF199|nr:hypothetical protein [Skermania sp. ID1734]TSE01852.1 hypothetical protein FOS14_00165 [Skermania sp. ID1734]
MSEAFDFDAAIDRAWAKFRSALADRLLQIPRGESVPLGPWDDPAAEWEASNPPQLRVAKNGRLRCEVPWDFHFTVPERNQARREALHALGWRQRASGNLVLEVSRREPDKLAALVVRALREVWQVPHPSFLEPADSPIEPVTHLAIEPIDRAHLQSLVDAALGELVRAPLVKAECGCIHFELGGRDCWLKVLEHAPTVEFCTTLAEHIVDAARTAAIIAEDRPRSRDVTLVRFEDSVIASLRMEATAFAACNLAAAMTKWAQFMSEEADELVQRLGGETDSEELPTELTCLLQLQSSDCPLDPAQVAAICNDDRRAILRCLRICAQQEAAWQQLATEAFDRGDHEEASACEGEARVWAETTNQLKAALRLVVLGKRRSA